MKLRHALSQRQAGSLHFGQAGADLAAQGSEGAGGQEIEMTQDRMDRRAELVGCGELAQLGQDILISDRRTRRSLRSRHGRCRVRPGSPGPIGASIKLRRTVGSDRDAGIAPDWRPELPLSLAAHHRSPSSASAIGRPNR